MDYSVQADGFAIPCRAEPTTRREKARLIAAASIGNFLEIFDFTVYSFFAGVIGQVFFQADDPMVALMLSVSVFGVGFVMRPLGSVILGSYADRRGRKAAMLVTIMLMAAGSALIGFAPSYASIGLAAPLLILTGRLLQGFSAGGEIGAATTLLLESASQKQRGFFVSWQYIGQGLSGICGALMSGLLFHYLSHEQLMSWGWRLPFIFSLLIIPVGLYIRAHVNETYAGETDTAADEAGEYTAKSRPVVEVMTKHFSQFILATLVVMPISLLVYIMIFYMPSYLKQVTGVVSSSGYFVSAGASTVMLVFSFVGGLVCDRVPRRKWLAVAILLVALLSCFVVFRSVGNHALFMGALTVNMAAIGMLMPTQALIVMEAFPRHVRATAMSVSYAAGVTLFGGTAQIVVTRLMMVSDANPMAPFWYLGTMLTLSVFAYMLFREKHYI